MEHVTYDYDTLKDGSAVHPAKFCGYGAIVEGNAVCQGYSSMFYRLALEAGIDCRIIRIDELDHAWNIILLDGKYYLIDCTWDDTAETTMYFLRGSRDFGHLNTDDEFSDTAFARRYPLHEYSRDPGMSPVKAGVTAPDYTLLTWDGRVSSTAARNGRAKVIVFMWEGCGFTEQLVQSLVGKGAYPGVDVLICYMYFEVELHLSWLNKIGASVEYPTNIPATYCYGGGSYAAMREMEARSGIRDENAVYSPTVFFITPQNDILFADHGFAGDLDALIYRYLADEGAPAPANGPVDGTCRAAGMCGDHAIWRFRSDGTLRIEGTGALYDNSGFMIGWLTERDWEWIHTMDVEYPDGTTAKPYVNLADAKGRYTLNPSDVKYVEVGEGITKLGAYVLSYFPNATIRFLGHAPTLTEEAVTYFDHAAITTDGYQIIVKYPANDATWTQQARDTLTGKDSGVVWMPVDANGVASIAAAKVTLSKSSYVFNGKVKKPKVTVKVGGVTLKNGTDYSVSYAKGRKAVGTYKVTVKGKGNYSGSKTATFKITKAAQPMKLKAVARNAKLSDVRKKGVTVAAPFKFTKKAQGKVTYAKVAKGSAKCLTVNKKTGKVTVKKGTKKGTYKVKIKVTAKGNKNYKSGSKTVTCKVVVK